ncbi:MAG TPA: carboxypeptidase-like regulatory domain-containing protein [Bryobacteraceae bacterium]|nr:carboxypeptidase-like regulatory domain-containing protein [Bryobacteraceae bacterium]
MWFATGLFLLAAATSFAQTESSSTVRGRVTGTSGEALRKTEVTLRAAEGEPGVVYAATTGADGSFVLDGIPPGQYRLSATHNGYLEQTYGPSAGDLFGGMGMVLTLTPGQRMAGIEFKLVRQAVVSGKIIDEDGDPAANVRVQVLREVQMGEGTRRFPVGQGAQTNDLGEYRVAGVAPGTYFLCASCDMAPDIRQERIIRKSPEETIPAVYYPGTLEVSQAGAIEVAAGAQLQGFDLQLKRIRAFRVSGRVVLPDDADPTSLFAHLQPKTDHVTVLGFGGGPQFGGDGSFDFGGVMPGSYELVVTYQALNHQRSTRTPVEVKDSSVEGLIVKFPPKTGIKIEGTVVGAVQKPSFIGPGSGIQVALKNLDNQDASASAEGGAGGAFSLENVAPGRYRVMAYNLPDDAYVQAVKYGGQESKDRKIEVSESASGKLEVVLAFDSGSVNGLVQDTTGAAALGAVVFLSPKSGAEEECDCSKMVSTDQNGRFRIRGVAPGEYQLLAIPASELQASWGPDFSKSHQADANSVTVLSSGSANVNLKMVSATR